MQLVDFTTLSVSLFRRASLVDTPRAVSAYPWGNCGREAQLRRRVGVVAGVSWLLCSSFLLTSLGFRWEHTEFSSALRQSTSDAFRSRAGLAVVVSTPFQGGCYMGF